MSIKEEKHSIAILMATFNGELYLKEQISSIIQQNFPNWRLYIRDDGSTDRTVELINGFVANDDRIVLLHDDCGNLGPTHNFRKLIEYALDRQEMFFCFADQDDVWNSEKLSMLLNTMCEMEQQFTESALLVHSDMEVVDSSLEVIDASFMDYQGIQHEEDALPVLLTQNFVTGCTMLVNRRLLDVAMPIPKEALLHDWWLALCAAVFGYIGYLSKPLVKYRQHDNNVVGTKHIGDFLNPVSGQWKQRWSEGRQNLFLSMKQAQALAYGIREFDPEHPHLALVEAYASLQEMSPLKRIRTLHNLGVHAQSKSRHALLLSRLLLTPAIQHG